MKQLIVNQVYKHSRTGKLYRLSNSDVPGKGNDNEWVWGVTYIGCYDGKTRWTTGARFLEAFEIASASETQFED